MCCHEIEKNVNNVVSMETEKVTKQLGIQFVQMKLI